MATTHHLLEDAREFYKEIQERSDAAEESAAARWRAVMALQRHARGVCIRIHVQRLHRAATRIQTAWRGHAARLLYRRLVREAARDMQAARYYRAAALIQAAYRGDRSRKTLFCYVTYRRWLEGVALASAQRLTQAAEFGARCRESGVRALEREAQLWLAFVVFKLHHLLRTASCAGVYSLQATTELSELERLLACVRYTEYMRRVRARYTKLARQSRQSPTHKHNTLFPVIGDGADYWYLSLAELYELTAPREPDADTRGLDMHRDVSLHPCPFLWCRAVAPPPQFLGRGPFRSTPPPKPTAASTDQRFHLYVKHYKPDPTVLCYVDFHINALLKKKFVMQKM